MGLPKTTLTGANQTTDWWDLRNQAESVCFILSGDFVDAVSVLYSNNEAASKGTDYVTDVKTYATKSGPLELPFGIAKFVAFSSGGSWSAGKTCIVSFGKGVTPNGQLGDVAVQGT